ncbi:MAG: ComEC/Rec2 family competence protein [Minisyncoccia bacterium]
MFEQKPKFFKTKLVFIILLFVIVDGILWYQILKSSKFVELYFLDVGQGDATLINFPFSGRILIDSGDGGKIEEALSKTSHYFNRSIDVWILSHANLDHYGGFLKLIDENPPQIFIYNGFDNQTKSFEELLNKLKQKQIPIITLAKGDKIKINDSQFYIVWPSQTTLLKDLNDLSLVLLFKNLNHSALFLGDVSKKILEQIKDFLSNEASIDILKVAHHGSKTSLNEEFFNLFRPKIALIGVGLNNQFGHPHQEVIDFLNKIGSEIFRTDIDHNIKIIFDNNLEIKKIF